MNIMEELTIVSGAPLPSIKRARKIEPVRVSKYDPLRDMKRGDCVVFDDDGKCSLAINWLRGACPEWRFTRRELDGGQHGIWRLK